jgi:hypothetical protein
VISSWAAIATAFADFNVCKLGVNADLAGCSTTRTNTMLAAHPQIALVRAACNACAYPPASKPVGARFAVAAEAAYNVASNAFDAATSTRCSAAYTAIVSTLGVPGADASKSACEIGKPYADAATAHAACLNPKLKILNPGPETLNPKPWLLNPKP